MSKLKFVFITKVNSSIGYGHFNRNIILGKELKKRGNKVQILIEGKFDKRFFSSKCSWINFKDNKKNKLPPADVCIVDFYSYKSEYYKKLKKFYEIIMLFDDCKYIVPDHVSGVINPNIHAQSKLYPAGIKVFSGKKYILIREEFNKIIKNKRRKHIFLCVGGSDPENQMNRLISILLKSTNLSIDAVYGPGFQNLKVVNYWKNHPRIFTHISVTEIGKLMSKAVYAVTSSGSMIYELASIGIPAISIALAHNQKPIGEKFKKSDLINYIGYFKNLTNYKIKNKIKNFEKKILSKKIFFKKEEIINKNGRKKLARDIEKWAIIKKDKLRTPYTKEDIVSEYNISAAKRYDYQRVHWGSRRSMKNRYIFVIRELPFDKIKKWIDVGSGTGNFQDLVSKKFSNVSGIGVEISNKLFSIAMKKKIKKIKFKNIDFLGHAGRNFDILTCLGVISKTNFNLKEFLIHSAKVIKKKGLLMMDFTNKRWKKFNNRNFFPDARHLWFTHEQIKKTFQENGSFKVIKLVGYSPAKDQIVSLKDSHSIFLIALKT